MDTLQGVFTSRLCSSAAHTPLRLLITSACMVLMLAADFAPAVFDVLGAWAWLVLGINAAPSFDKPWLVSDECNLSFTPLLQCSQLAMSPP